MSRPFIPPKPVPGAPMREWGIVMLVDARGKVLHRIVFKGQAARLTVPWRRIVQAVVGSRCHGIILLHSHTSQDASPSAADIRVTRRMAHMLSPLGVRLCDHVIVAGSTHFSFRASGLV